MREFKGCKNFTLVSKEWLEDVAAYGYILKHDKTGARVCLIANDDSNKVFVIGFRTIPEDSTGVAHILEHSVLCGSEKYPVKDAMTEVMKGSLNTFINAFTYSDRTLYPVASCNEKDFNNLMQVYLDAVFNPRVHKEPRTFLQEGWHYEMEDPEGDITINGVVYNEMKGVYSSPQDLCSTATINSLFPDTQYSVDSGGDPAVIPELTYEYFKNFHKRMYHPSNARIYIYGDTDFEEKLEYIDKEYLSKYDAIDPKTEIALQKTFDAPKTLKKEFSVNDEDATRDSGFLTYNVCCADFNELEIIDAINIINYALVSVPGAKLKERLIDAGIGKDVYSSFVTDCGQKVFSIVAESANAEDEAKFVEIIESTIKEIIEEGFDKKTLMAAISGQEFSYKEADYGLYPRGLIYAMWAFENWNYTDEDVFLSLKQNKVFKELGEKIETGYFESVLKERILENNHKTIFTMVPVAGLQAKEDEELKEKLAAYKATLSKEDIDKLIEETKALKAYQEAEDSEENLATIPTLSKEDIPVLGRTFKYEEVKKDDITYIETEQFTNNIVYANISFSFKAMPQKYIPYLSILKVLLGQISTKSYKYGELINEMGIVSGGIGVNTTVYRVVGEADAYDACLEAKLKCLYDKIPENLELVKEILFTSNLDDKKRIKDILEETKTRIQGYMISSGHGVALQRMNSYLCSAAVLAEMLSGMEQYKFIEDLCNNFDEKIDDLILNMKELTSYIYAKENLTVSVSADRTGIECFEKEFSDFFKNIPSKNLEISKYTLEVKNKKEAFTCASQVQYVALGGNFVDKGLEYTGALSVLRNILSNDYLWTAVRLQGGAYGTWFGVNRNGDGYMVSYRDPNLEKTLDAYKGAYDYIDNYSGSEEDVDRFVISTIGDVDTPFTPSIVAGRCFGMYKTNVTNEMVAKERKEILSTDVETIKGLSKYIQAVLDYGALVCVGGEKAIEEASDLFLSKEPLYKA
ncbi:MAG: insulinase family protein [Lachnospiraceae bacterium]|nr:insulinase family protein [Lachnospiraceae bacterium]